MKKQIVWIFILLPIFKCLSQKGAIEKIEFKNQYQFGSDIEHKVSTDTVPWKYQKSASEYALKGDYKNALKHWELAMKKGTDANNYTLRQKDSINQKYHIVSASEYILEESKKNQIIIINEAHTNSFHRIYTKSLLQELYNNGYKNLGLEALGLDSLLHERKYPTQETGYYTKDPQFGNLIRDALAIGYHLFSYEDREGNNGKLREIGQAKNIQKVIQEKPNEKFLIHCGHGHVLEGNYKPWEKTMAGRLLEYTGINPFTINQTFYSERSKVECNNLLLQALTPKEPSILLDENNVPLKFERGECWTDVAILHPITKYIDDRPSWLFDSKNINVAIELKEIDIPYPLMVFAFKKGDNINEAVPIDIYEVKNKTTSPHLALPKGKYEIVVVNKKDEARKFELEIE